VGFFYELLTDGVISKWGVLQGGGLGLALAVFETSRFARAMRTLPFGVALLTKAFTYIAVMAIPFLILGLIGGLLEGLTMADYVEWIFSRELLNLITVAFVAYVVILFFRQLDRMLGPGILLRYLTGRYHRPKSENRIFMFLDMKSSTTLAEQMDREAYYGLLNTFFRDLTEPILESSAEIYQYVGDEVVLTWPLDRGLSRSNCLRVFSRIDAVIEGHRDKYMSRFGVVPEYKAGVHHGEVITAEIGDLKKDIVYNGDVLNTTARIQASCKSLGKRLLVSRSLVELLTVPDTFRSESVGPVSLAGKAEPVELVALA
jgi:adenylate cyclase